MTDSERGAEPGSGLNSSRTPSHVDALAEEYLEEFAQLDPISATYIGLSGFDDRMPDLSPAGLDAAAELDERTLKRIEATAFGPDAEAIDDVDRVTIAALTERLGVARELHAIGADASALNNIASPVQNVRDVFDLMPTATADDWHTIANRLNAIPAALGGYITSLRTAAANHDVAARRQVEACISQCEANLGPDGFFARYVAAARAGDQPLEDSLQCELDRASHAAQAGYQSLRDFLAEELAGQARETDPVGRERYQLFSRNSLGATVDLEETYDWGQHELARITSLMSETARRVRPGATIEQAIELLDHDPARKLAGTAALQAWMQQTADTAVAALADLHFDIPEPIRTLECRIAPTNTGGIYYTGPSDDFSRPGRMWWSVPAGVEEFSTWRELTTVYHEGVPGHHLQVAQTAYRGERLNRWRRLASWTSGHGEGWALYAEWLMADLGYLGDPGDFMGLLDGQSLRAARVVLDIGIHCGFQAPSEVGGGAWDYDKAWQFLTTHSHMAEGFLRYELDRYLGWPGQAPSYKIGERLWLQLRDEMRQRAGGALDLKTFHRQALDIGSVGLDVLRRAVLGEL